MTTARSNGALINKKPFKVLVCLVTLVAFLCNTVLFDSAWAVGTPSGLPGSSPDRAGGSGLFKELHVDTFTLPEYLGHIKDQYKSDKSDKTIIHIQDAHCNYACQQKIAEIIEYINKEYGVGTVNLEGGAKDYDLSIFTDITDKTIRDKTADYFVKEGLVNGAEYFAVNNPEKVSLWGIEDTKLYIDNLSVYRNSLTHKEEVDKHLKTLNHILSNLKSKIYSKELLDFDMKYSAYKANNMEFKDYLGSLIAIAKSKGIDIKSLPNIVLLNQTLGEEGRIDFKKANNERDDLIDKLQKKLSRNALEELVLKTVEFRSEKISQKNFYSYLTTKVKDKEITLSEFPDLQKHIVYVSTYETIDKAKVMEEIDTLESEIKDALCSNDEERQLSTLSKNLSLLKNIFGITLTKDDYKYYKTHEDSFDMSAFVSFINKNAPLYSITAKLDENVQNIDQYRKEIERFYEYSLKRDEAFLKNMRVAKSTIIVTGGFHTGNLCEIFKKNGISYVSIMPNFKNYDGYKCPYFRLLAGARSDRDKKLDAIASSVSNIAIASILNFLGPLIEGKEAQLRILLEIHLAIARANNCVGIEIIKGNESKYYDFDLNPSDGTKGKFKLIPWQISAGLALPAHIKTTPIQLQPSAISDRTAAAPISAAPAIIESLSALTKIENLIKRGEILKAKEEFSAIPTDLLSGPAGMALYRFVMARCADMSTDPIAQELRKIARDKYHVILLNGVNPVFGKAWALLIKEYPAMRNGRVTLASDEESEAYPYTGGFFKIDEFTEEPVIAIIANKGHIDDLKITRPASVKAVAELLNISLDDITPQLLALFVFLHEVGHMRDYLADGLNPEQYSAKKRAELLTLPHFPGLNPVEARKTVMNEMRQSLDQDTERKLREHDEAYRKLPSQRNADMFAARFIGKHVGKGPQLAAKVAVFAMQTTPPQAETNIGRLARVRAMTDKAKNPEEVRAMLSAIESLPVEQRRDAEMALRVLLETRAIGCLTPGLTNVVVQFVNINQVKQNDAVNATKDIEDYLNKPGGSYRGECESIIGGMLNNTDEDSIEKAILSAVRKMNAGNDSKAIFEVPSWMADSFSKVLKGQNLFKNEQRNRETGAIESIESNDPRIKVQIIEQEGEPDVRTQFKFGIAVLEWVRRGGESGKTDEADKALLNLIAFMIDGYLDPHTGLKDLLFKNVMKIRKIDWRIMDQQRKSWEAVATAL